MGRYAPVLPVALLALQVILEFVLVAMITNEFGATKAAVYFTTIAQLAVWNLVFTSGFQDFLIVTKMAGARSYLRLSIIGLMFGAALASTAVEVEYALGLALSTAAVLLGKWVGSLIRISDRVFVAISIEATTAVITKICLAMSLIYGLAGAKDLLLFSYVAAVMPVSLAALVGLAYCQMSRSLAMCPKQEYVHRSTMIGTLYSLKMAGQLYRKADVLIVNTFFPPAAVTAYAIIKQLISASYKISGKIYAQVAIIQAKLKEDNKSSGVGIISKNFYASALAMAFFTAAIYVILIFMQIPYLEEVKWIVTENGMLYLSVFVNYLILTRANLFSQVLKAWGFAGDILLYSVVLSLLQLTSLSLASLFIGNIVIAVWINTLVSAVYFLPIMRGLYKKHAK